MRYLSLPALLAVILSFTKPVFASENKSSFSKKQVMSDLTQVVRLLKKFHPNLYTHRRPKEFQAIVKKVRGDLSEGMSRLDAITQIQKILASVCDEHTSIVLSPKNERPTFEQAKYFSSSLISRQGRIVVGNNSKSTNSEVILEVGNRTSDEINEFMQNLQSQDGCLDPKTHVIDGSTYLDTLFLGNYLYNGNENVQVKLRNHSNQIVNRNQSFTGFSGIATSLGFVYAMKSILSNIVLKQNNFNYENTDFNRDYFNKEIESYLFYNGQKNVYFLKIGSFVGGKKFDTLINNTMRKVIAAKPAHVIIDLTDNPGGRILSASKFLSYFLATGHRPARYLRVKNPAGRIKDPIIWKSVKRKKAHFKSMRTFRRVKQRRGQYKLPYRSRSYGNPDYKGKITVLVGPRTHSAATMVAVILKNKRNAKIIGHINKRSASTACYAPGGSFRLKNTRLLVDIPFACYDRDRKKYSGQEILKPDIEVNPMVSSSSNLGGRIIEAALQELEVLEITQ